MGCVHGIAREAVEHSDSSVKQKHCLAQNEPKQRQQQQDPAQQPPVLQIHTADPLQQPKLQQADQQQAQPSTTGRQPQPEGTHEPASTDGVGTSPLLLVWDDGGMPIPEEEQLRLDCLAKLKILDTEPEEAYDRITKLCTTLFKVPIALVTFVDADRVWLKSVQGLTGLKQVDRRHALCAWLVLTRYPEALVVPDLTEDVRFQDYPIVTQWPHARFYAGCPLITVTGERVGTLCVLDTKPREDFTAESTSLLGQLALLVMREAERRAEINSAQANATSLRLHARDRQAVILCDVSQPGWPVLLVNDAWQRATGISREVACSSNFWDLFDAPPASQLQACTLAVEQHRSFELRVLCHPGGTSDAAGATRLVRVGSLGGPDDGGRGGSFNGNADDAQGSGLNQGVGLSGRSGTAASTCKGAPSANGGLGPGSVRGTSVTGSALSGSNAFSVGGNALFSGANCQPGSRWVRMQFRSASSASAFKMAPTVSVPSVLQAGVDTGGRWYWATADAPNDASHNGTSHFDSQAVNAGNYDGNSDDGSSSSSHGRYSGEVSGSAPATPAGGHTTFSLMPEDNPFQDITIGSLLGWGSYGRVHRGYWNGTLVAVKVLEQIAGDFNPRTTLEPLLHHRLSHPNVVKMYDISTQEVDICEDGRPLQEVWMCLEYCNRGTLSDAIARGAVAKANPDGAPIPGTVDLRAVLATAREIAGAMQYLHEQNVLHGDLNGNNILLSAAPDDWRGFTVKVADFGLSRMLAPDDDRIITRTHGTITHMSPEVIMASTHSRKADVYSFGVVLWEMYQGERPYNGLHYAQIVQYITSEKGLPIPDDAPADFQMLLRDCLHLRPDNRPPFAEVFKRLSDMEAAMPPDPTSPGSRPVVRKLLPPLPHQTGGSSAGSAKSQPFPLGATIGSMESSAGRSVVAAAMQGSGGGAFGSSTRVTWDSLVPAASQ